jgi:hypothetical protein
VPTPVPFLVNLSLKSFLHSSNLPPRRVNLFHERLWAILCSITHVKAVGVPLPHLRCKPDRGGRILEYHADAPPSLSMEVEPPFNVLDAALYVAELDSDDEDVEDEIWD